MEDGRDCLSWFRRLCWFGGLGRDYCNLVCQVDQKFLRDLSCSDGPSANQVSGELRRYDFSHYAGIMVFWFISPRCWIMLCFVRWCWNKKLKWILYLFLAERKSRLEFCTKESQSVETFWWDETAMCMRFKLKFEPRANRYKVQEMTCVFQTN